MSILIQGMEMPKNCFECPCCTLGYCRVDVKTTEYAKYVFSDGQDGRYPDCPLVEIPTPHGRLIDADKLKSRLVLDNDSNELQRISADILKWIDIQETVIEGSET